MPGIGGTLALMNKKEKERGRLPTGTSGVASGGVSPRHSPSSPSHRRFNQSPGLGPSTSAATFSSLSQTSLQPTSHVAAATGEGRHPSPRSSRHTTAASPRKLSPAPAPTVVAVASVAVAADPPDYASCCCYPAMRFALSSDAENGRRRKVNQETIATTAVTDHNEATTGQLEGNGDHHHHHQQQQQHKHRQHHHEHHREQPKQQSGRQADHDTAAAVHETSAVTPTGTETTSVGRSAKSDG